MSIILMQVRPFGLSPVAGWDEKQQKQYPLDSVVHISITRSKSRKMLRFYWALVDLVADAIGYDKEVLSDELLVRTGRVDTFGFINGDISVQPKRISKMKHDIFKSYVDSAVKLICDEYIAEMTASQLLLKVEQMLGITYEDAFRAPPRGKKNNVECASSEGFILESEGSGER